MATAIAAPKPEAAAAGAVDNAWQEAGWLPCKLSVDVPVAGFTVGDLLSLEINSLVHSGVAREADVPVRVNGQEIGSAELDAAGNRIAVRLVELA